jgi:hypothetical protein
MASSVARIWAALQDSEKDAGQAHRSGTSSPRGIGRAHAIAGRGPAWPCDRDGCLRSTPIAMPASIARMQPEALDAAALREWRNGTRPRRHPA